MNDTRQRLVDAAIKTIYEGGFGNTSSSEVARRIGATWSVIQYHFGSWEALLLEAVKQICDKNYDALSEAMLTGETTEERLQIFCDTVFRIFGDGRYAAIRQIAHHLFTNPKTHASTLQLINDTVARQDAALETLLAQVSPRFSSKELRDLVRYAFIGLAMSLETSRRLYQGVQQITRHPDETTQRALLTKAIALLLESREDADLRVQALPAP